MPLDKFKVGDFIKSGTADIRRIDDIDGGYFFVMCLEIGTVALSNYIVENFYEPATPLEIIRFKNAASR